MDQKKIGSFMKELRIKKQYTQEEFAEILGISNRTVSRWERENEKMIPNTKESVLKVAEYNHEESLKMMNKMKKISMLGFFSMILYLILLAIEPSKTPIIDFITGLMLGISFASIIVNLLHSTQYGLKIRTVKSRILTKMNILFMSSQI